MGIFDEAVRLLERMAEFVPIEVFAFVGSVIEEIVAPIPSPIVMTLVGSLAKAQGQPFMYLFFLALLGGTGKTTGAWVLYFVSDKLEDVVVGKFGKFLGVSHKEIENIGKKLNGGWKDNVFLFFARALPIIPSAPVSIACGVIRLNKRTYITSTLAGTVVRDFMYLYLGYVGLSNYQEISHGFDSVESVVQILLFAAIALLIVWSYYKRRKNSKAERNAS